MGRRHVSRGMKIDRRSARILRALLEFPDEWMTEEEVFGWTLFRSPWRKALARLQGAGWVESRFIRDGSRRYQVPDKALGHARGAVEARDSRRGSFGAAVIEGVVEGLVD